MSTDSQTTASSLPLRPATHSAVHPLAPVNAEEIRNAVALVRTQWPQGQDLQFKVITLEEPVKAEMVRYLDAEAEGSRLPDIDRRVLVTYYLRRTNRFHEAVVNLTRQAVEHHVRLGANMHAPGDGAEIAAMERIALEDEGVRRELEKMRLPAGSRVVVDPWIYGSDGVDDDERMWQCFLYLGGAPDEPDANHYARPLSVSPVIGSETMRVLRIDHLPTGLDGSTPSQPQPYRVPPANEYLPSHQELRTDLRPLQVVQPEGASFTVTPRGTSSLVRWQKWSFRLGFNHREGMVLYDVRYDGRPLFYRLALSDMNIPYADPRPPFHRKSAFDLGDAGAGIMANDLRLGCDCLGAIHYLSATLADDRGEPLEMPNVVCVHEQDGGIGWKHTNYRTGRAAVVRSRELVVQSIITVANYEYILAFQFTQAGELAYEVRATGILSTQPIDPSIPVSEDIPWGTVVHPGVLAAHHQHIFSLRIDPMIDGHANQLVYTDAVPLPRSADLNPHGTGYRTATTPITTSGGYDVDWDANRTFSIRNNAVRNPINGQPVAYKIHAPPFQKMLSDRDSYNFRRAEFADRDFYVTRYREDELFAGGKYTNQSRGGHGVRGWAARGDDVADQDIVVFVQFGINHIPRIEDFPVMPCEILKVSLKPVNFFDRNPALDVPPSTQQFNRSTLLSEQHHQPAAEASCCPPAASSRL